MWTVPIEEMNCRWVEGRVPKIDLNLLKRRCKSPVDTAEEEQDEITFRYPSKCDGIGDLWKRFADKFPQKVFIYNTEVLNIDTSVKKACMFFFNPESSCCLDICPEHDNRRGDRGLI